MTVLENHTNFNGMANLMDLKLYLLTWNVVGRPPIEDLRYALGLNDPVDVSNLPDFYGLGLQEVSCKPQDLIAEIIVDDPWDTAFREVLCKWDYVKLKQIRLQGMVLYLFCKREHVTHIRGLQTSYTRTGLRGMWGNKGGVSIRFTAYGCSICIVNSHLAAHDAELKQRIDDYNSILDHQKFTDPLTENIITHDYTFWIGDLNFRLDDYSSEEIVDLVKKKNLSHLLVKDQAQGNRWKRLLSGFITPDEVFVLINLEAQANLAMKYDFTPSVNLLLRKVMKLGQAFSEFNECPPVFSPTYKFDIDGEDYDISKRRPAWTDRILFRFTSNAYENVVLNLKQLHYDSHDFYRQSDHKPVTSSFSLKVFSQPIEKKVSFLPISDWKVNADSVAWYTFSDGAEPSTWDWIGLYKADYTSTEEHVCYIWAPVRPSGNTPVVPVPDSQSSEDEYDDVGACASSSVRQHQGPWYRIVFADQTLLIPGRYRLFYISAEFDNILGISDPFEYDPRNVSLADGSNGGGSLFDDLPLLVSLAVVLVAIIMQILYI